jgi:glucosamine kinase
VKNQVLISESGGSKTDWALVREGEIIFQFSSESFHPKNWNTSLFNDLLYDFIEKQLDFQNTKLIFFGAGCNNLEKADELKKNFKLFGFQEVEISGDLQAACLATLNKSAGFVAILGSGSVLIEYKNQTVTNYFGGLGRELGDEGAGYYFGKLVLMDYTNNKLEPIQKSILKSVLSIQEIASLGRNELEDELCLDLSKRLGNNLFEFQNYHRKNIDLFYSKYVQPNVVKGTTIQLVGSYAFYHQEIIKSYFRAKGYKIGNIIARPIDKIIELFH